MMSFHLIRSNHEFNLSDYWMPSLGSSESWEIVFGCHEDAAKVELCKIKEKEGRKEGRKEELIPIWVSKLNYSQEKFALWNKSRHDPSVPHLYSLQIGSWPLCPLEFWNPTQSVCMYVYMCEGASNWQNQSASHESTSNISCTGKKLTSFEKKYHSRSVAGLHKLST